MSDERDYIAMNKEVREIPHPVAFGRWLLKYAEIKFTEDGCLVWGFDLDEWDTDELFTIFCIQQGEITK